MTHPPAEQSSGERVAQTNDTPPPARCSRCYEAEPPARRMYTLDPASIAVLRARYGAKRVSYALQKAIDEMIARESGAKPNVNYSL